MDFTRNPEFAEFELSAEERLALRRWQSKATLIPSQSLGYFSRDGQGEYVRVENPETYIAGFSSEALVALLKKGEVSVCGRKLDLLWDLREFEDGSRIYCTAFAVLGIYDSPVHFHRKTTEVYSLVSGKGWLVFDNEIKEMQPGDSVEIPVNIEHGFFAEGEPAVIKIRFLPDGLAPLPKPDQRCADMMHRDEEITYSYASARLAQLAA